VDDTGTDTRNGTRDRVKAINRAIVAEEKRLRARHRWLAHQDAIGMSCFVGGLAVIAALVWAYFAGHLPWWGAVLCSAAQAASGKWSCFRALSPCMALRSNGPCSRPPAPSIVVRYRCRCNARRTRPGRTAAD